jgi:aquaporin Z
MDRRNLRNGLLAPGIVVPFPDAGMPVARTMIGMSVRLHHSRGDGRAGGFAPIAIGLGLTLVHLIGIPVTNLSVNPARRTGPALFVGGWALGQLWLFWAAPLVGAVLAGLGYRALAEPESDVMGVAAVVVTATTTVE